MFASARNYFRELVEDFGAGWNRFWFTPRTAETLSVMRVLLGAIALFWIATFTPDVQRLLSFQSIVSPEKLVLLSDLPAASFSYFNLLTTPGAVMAGHIVGMLVVVLFTLGVATRATSIMAALVVLSYIDRTWVMASSFEAVLAMMMVYMCVGASGTCLSVDAWWRKKNGGETNRGAPSPTVWNNLATRLMQVHLTLIYFMMVVAKLRDGDWWAGQAVGWLWSRGGETRLVDLSGLLAYPYIVNAATLAVMAFELTFVFLVWHRRVRPLALGVSACVWLLLALTTGLTAFCLLMLVANLMFVSPAAMRAAVGMAFAAETARTTAS